MPVLTISTGLVDRLATALRGPGIVGAFYGQRLERDAWSTAFGVSYHAAASLDRVAPLRLPRSGNEKSRSNDFPELDALTEWAIEKPSTFENNGPLVVEPYIQRVGRVSLHTLSYSDFAGRRGSSGTITALVGDGHGETLALLSGHASLPRDHDAGRLLETLDEGDTPHPVVAASLEGAVHGLGYLVRGRAGGMSNQDWGLARFSEPTNLLHPRLGRAPFPMRRAEPVAGDPMWIVSTVRPGQTRLGHVRQVGVVQLPNGNDTLVYSGVYAIYPQEDGGFSIHGDSGALVFDQHDQVWGIIIGGPDSEAAPRTVPSYALPIAGLPDDLLNTFFIPA